MLVAHGQVEDLGIQRETGQIRDDSRCRIRYALALSGEVQLQGKGRRLRTSVLDFMLIPAARGSRRDDVGSDSAGRGSRLSAATLRLWLRNVDEPTILGAFGWFDARSGTGHGPPRDDEMPGGQAE